MNKTISDIRDDAMALPVEDRANLARELIESLYDTSIFGLSEEAEAEIQRRIRMVREDAAVGKPIDEVCDRIRSKYSDP